MSLKSIIYESLKPDIVSIINDKYENLFDAGNRHKDFVSLDVNEVEYKPNYHCEPNKCETNAYQVVKSYILLHGNDSMFPVGGFLIERTTPIEHWWVYHPKSDTHVEVTPLKERQNIKGYFGIINRSINEQISNSRIVWDVDFFKGGHVYFNYFKR